MTSFQCLHQFSFSWLFRRWFLISLQDRKLQQKMSKTSIFRQKLFRWKEKEKIPKTEWPELVGKNAEEATTIIDKEQPGLKIQIIPENSFVVRNLEEKRVRIYVDKKQTVVKTPRIG